MRVPHTASPIKYLQHEHLLMNCNKMLVYTLQATYYLLGIMYMHKQCQLLSLLYILATPTSPGAGQGSHTCFIRLLISAKERGQVYSEAVVITGIHADCFLYVNGAADNDISPPDVVLNVCPARLTVTKPCSRA